MRWSYTSGREPLSLLRKRIACGYGLPPWIVLSSSAIQHLRYMYSSNQCDGRAPMHAVLEQSQRNPCSQQLCGVLTHESSVLFLFHQHN